MGKHIEQMEHAIRGNRTALVVTARRTEDTKTLIAELTATNQYSVTYGTYLKDIPIIKADWKRHKRAAGIRAINAVLDRVSTVHLIADRSQQYVHDIQKAAIRQGITVRTYWTRVQPEPNEEPQDIKKYNLPRIIQYNDEESLENAMAVVSVTPKYPVTTVLQQQYDQLRHYLLARIRSRDLQTLAILQCTHIVTDEDPENTKKAEMLIRCIKWAIDEDYMPAKEEIQAAVKAGYAAKKGTKLHLDELRRFDELNRLKAQGLRLKTNVDEYSNGQLRKIAYPVRENDLWILETPGVTIPVTVKEVRYGNNWSTEHQRMEITYAILYANHLDFAFVWDDTLPGGLIPANGWSDRFVLPSATRFLPADPEVMKGTAPPKTNPLNYQEDILEMPTELKERKQVATTQGYNFRGVTTPADAKVERHDNATYLTKTKKKNNKKRKGQ